MIINKHLTSEASLNLISYLQQHYPVPNLVVKFQPNPVATFKLPIGPWHIKGGCSGSTITISTFERDATDELRIIAHEYRHAIQNTVPRVSNVIKGTNINVDKAAEDDANAFSKEVVSKFLEENHVK